MTPTVEVIEIPLQSSALPVEARFIGRIPSVGVVLERDAAMAALAPHQRRLLSEQGLGSYPLVTAEQIHGAEIATVTTATLSPTLSPIRPFSPSPSLFHLPGVDGLITATRGLTLGISVADCAAVWLVARDGSAGGLLHSGKKGTALGIVSAGIHALCALADLSPQDLILIVSPCIRPPCYEVDFAAEIAKQAMEAGLTSIYDERICTACQPERYYSYRLERGLTGRMLATLTLLPQ